MSALLDAIANELEKDGYARPVPGIFTRKLDTEWSGWISISEGTFAISPTIGLLNRTINKVLYAVLKEISTGSDAPVKRASYGPAFVMAPLRVIVLGNASIDETLPWEHTGEKLKLDILDGLLHHIHNEGFRFIEENRNLPQAIETVFTYNKFMQAQQYCIPVALLMLDRRSDFKSYVDECLARLPPGGARQTYQQYILTLPKTLGMSAS